MPSATSDLPEPVGVPRITWSPAARSMRASSWCSQSSMPRSSHQPRKRSKASSAVHQGSGSSPSAGSHQLGESAPSEPCSPVLPVPAANELAEDPAVAAADAFAVSAVLAMEMMPFGFALDASRVECCINYGRWWAERHGAAPVGGDVRAICPELAVRGPFIHQSRALMAAELARARHSFHFWEHFLPFARYHVIAFLNPAVLLRLDRLAAMVSKRYSQK